MSNPAKVSKRLLGWGKALVLPLYNLLIAIKHENLSFITEMRKLYDFFKRTVNYLRKLPTVITSWLFSQNKFTAAAGQHQISAALDGTFQTPATLVTMIARDEAHVRPPSVLQVCDSYIFL